MAGLYLSGPLGSYPDRVEFQVGTTIVQVVLPRHGTRDAWLARANQIFETIWRDIPRVISAAQKASRTELPEFWKAHDEAGTADQQLAVRGIWIEPAKGTADYDVGRNFDFDTRRLLDLPELSTEYSVMVVRNPNGDLHCDQ
jgi:hypothetical protein